jgi:para-nitrobenzyl esterase
MLKHIFLLFIAFFSFFTQGNAQTTTGCDGSRYVYPTFTNVTKTTVQFGENTTLDTVKQQLKMDIYAPEGDKLAKRPVVLLAFGGSFIRGMRSDLQLLCEVYAKQGFVAVSIDYRLYPTKLGAPDSINATQAIVQPIMDMKAAIRFLRKDAATANIFKIDPNFIIIGGISAGAITAIHAAILDKNDVLPSLFAQVVAKNGGLEGNSGDAENLKYSSTVQGIINLSGASFKKEWFDKNSPPIASMHGEADNVVPFKQGLANGVSPFDGSFLLHERAKAFGVPNMLVSVPEGLHTDIYFDPKFKAYQDDFFKKLGLFVHNIVCPNVRVSAKELKEDLDLKIYPNPSHEAMTVEITNSAEIRVTNIGGQLVQHIITNQNIVLEKASIGTGIFFVQIVQKDGVAVKKVVFE